MERHLYPTLAAFIVLAFAAFVPATALATSPNPPARVAASTTEIGAYKARHDTDPHLPLSASDLSWLAQKEEMARVRALHRADYTRTGESPASAPYASKYLGGTQQGQQTSYYCGPAAVSEALALKGVSLSQSDAASLLRTTTDGTAWSGVNANVPSPTGYPVRDVLNYKLNTSWYVPLALPYSPSSSDVSAYVDNMSNDIDLGWPLIGDAWEVPNGPHLVGHPVNLEIYHWFTINGYNDWGNQTQYMDSATTIWPSVPPYTSNFSSSTLVTILGGRGYVW